MYNASYAKIPTIVYFSLKAQHFANSKLSTTNHNYTKGKQYP